MQVVRVRDFGGPEMLETADIPDPEPGPGDLLVEVEVAEVLFLDTQLRAGWGRDFFTVEPPFVPGVGVAGVAQAVGEGVDAGWVGRRVIAATSASGEYRGGGYAERAVVPASCAYAIPGGLDAQQAIAALHDGAMGVSRVEKAGLGAGETALITAASGAIGTWLVPLLKAADVTVIAAGRGERKLALAAERGAEVVVDYGDDGWAAGIDREVDVVFDGAGGEIGTDAFGLLRRGGRYFSYGSATGAFPDIDAAAAQRDIEVIGLHERFTAEDMHRATATALRRLTDGTVDAVIGQVAALDQASGAHAAIADRRVVGKTLLLPR